MAKVTLREYQSELINGARQEFRAGHRSCVLVLPTGGGKGKILPAIAAPLVSAGKRVLVLAHRNKLIKQLAESLDMFDVCYDQIKGSRRQKYKCSLGMVESVRRRMDKMEAPDYILVDEGHHTPSSQYRAIFENWPNARIIGVTATPARNDDSSLGDIFTSMVIGPTMRWLIDNGFLAKYDYYEPPSHIDLSTVKMDKSGDYKEADVARVIRSTKVVGDTINNYRNLMKDKSAIVFCTGIDHAKEVAAEFNAAGILSAHIDGTMPESQQDDLMDDLKHGRIKCLMSADLIGEGVDIPSVTGCILLRPTASVVIYLQQVGRALRLKSDGSRAIIIDPVGNRRSHGYPCDPREWTLTGKIKKAKEVCVRTCDKCARSFHAHEAKEIAENECEYQFECPFVNGTQKTVIHVTEQIEGELVKAPDPWEWADGIDPILATGDEWKALMAKASDEDKLKQIQRARGYDARWVGHQLIAKGLKKKTRSFSKYTGR